MDPFDVDSNSTIAGDFESKSDGDKHGGIVLTHSQNDFICSKVKIDNQQSRDKKKKKIEIFLGETTLNSLQNGIQSTMYNVQREIGAKLRLKIEKKVFF